MSAELLTVTCTKTIWLRYQEDESRGHHWDALCRQLPSKSSSVHGLQTRACKTDLQSSLHKMEVENPIPTLAGPSTLPVSVSGIYMSVSSPSSSTSRDLRRRQRARASRAPPPSRSRPLPSSRARNGLDTDRVDPRCSDHAARALLARRARRAAPRPAGWLVGTDRRRTGGGRVGDGRGGAPARARVGEGSRRRAGLVRGSHAGERASLEEAAPEEERRHWREREGGREKMKEKERKKRKINKSGETHILKGGIESLQNRGLKVRFREV